MKKVQPPFFLILLIGHCLNAQNAFVPFEHLDERNGLVNNIVYDLAQDTKGYIWVATHGGIQKFDGTKFTSIILQSGDRTSVNKIVFKISLSKKENKLWFVTAEGIFLFDINKKIVKAIRLNSPSYNWANVSSFVEDFLGIMWICSPKDGLYFYDKRSNMFEPYIKKWPHFPGKFLTIQPAISTNSYLLSTKKGIVNYAIDSKKYSIYKVKNYNIHHIPSNLNSSFWYTLSNDKTRELNIENYDFVNTRTRFRNKISHDIKIESIHATKNNKILALGTSLYWFNTSTLMWDDLINKSGFNTFSWFDKENCIMEDRDGLIWVGTNNGIQILKTNDFQFRNIYLDQPDNSSEPLFIPLSDSLNLFISLINKKSSFQLVDHNLYQKKNTWIDKINNLNLTITSICRDNNGNVFASCLGGKILQIEVSKKTFNVRFVSELHRKKIIQMAVDHHKNIWLVSDQIEVIKWVIKSNSFIKVEHTLDSTLKIKNLSFFPDADLDALWLSFPTGLGKINPQVNAIDFYDYPYNLFTSEIKNWNIDSLIAGTNKGIYLINKTNPSSLSKLKTKGDTLSLDVASLDVDLFHNLWISSPGKGIINISNGGRSIRNITKQNGVYFKSADSPFTTHLSNDRILIRGNEGFLTFLPATVSQYSNPRVRITSLSVNDQPINPDSISKENISLDWWQNSIGFEFSSPSYALKNSIKYSYQLEGHDANWINTSNNSKIIYANLKPGNYKFKIRSQILFQDELSDEDEFSFSIDNQLFDRTYFKLLVVIALIIIIYIFYRLRINQFIAEADIKNKLSRDLHDNIGSSLSSISIMLKVAIMQSDENKIQTLLNKIAKNTHMTQENLEDIVWNINSINRNLSEIVDRMQEFLYGIFESQQIKIIFNIDEKIKSLVLSADRRYDLFLIFKELINNAAKYAEATEITLDLSIDMKFIKLSYLDNGVGFNLDEQINGNGLTNIRNRVKNLRGMMTMESSLGAGTTFLLKFPIE